MKDIWKNYKVIIIIVVVIIVILFIYLLMKPSAVKPIQVSPGGMAPASPSNSVQTLLNDLGSFLSGLFTKKPTSSKAGCPSITGNPVVFGCGCPNAANKDNNGNPCPAGCTNGCKDGVSGIDCNGNASQYC